MPRYLTSSLAPPRDRMISDTRVDKSGMIELSWFGPVFRSVSTITRNETVASRRSGTPATTITPLAELAKSDNTHRHDRNADEDCKSAFHLRQLDTKFAAD